MIITILLFILGLLLLIKCGNYFVDGAVGIAERFKVPELIIGATIVSAGTTLPEVIVSAQAAIIGNGAIAYGNAIGSIICNVALICAITCLFRPQKINKEPLKLPLRCFFIAAIFYSIVAYFSSFTRCVGIILLIMYIIYMGSNIKFSKTDKITDEICTSKIKLSKSILYLVLGAIGVAFGANLLINKGTLIAQFIGVPDSVIGLTIVALGTSLPEFTTALISLKRGHSELSIGNVLGANLFNLVWVSGLSITISPFNLPTDKLLYGINASLLVDLPLMFIVMLILYIPTTIKGHIYRWQGITLISIYSLYVLFQFLW